MAEKVNQHFVPQFYFRYFSPDGKSISFLNRSTGQLVQTASIKGQASRKHFYGDSKIETILSQVEGEFCGALKNLKTSYSFDALSYKDRLLVLQNIMLQKARTAAARIKSKAMLDRLFQLWMECEVNNDENLDDDTKVNFRKIANTLEADHQNSQALHMSIAMECAVELGDLVPLVLLNKTNRPFIFGDAPVVFINPLLRQIRLRGVLGARTPGLIVLYPLSSTHCAMLVDIQAYKLKRFRSSLYTVRELSDVAAMNKLQIHNASSAVYFSDFKYSQYVEGLYRQEKTKLHDHQGKVVEAPGFTHDGEPMGDIIHSFEPQLPFLPRFSFLDYSEVSERDYRFSYRN